MMFCFQSIKRIHDFTKHKLKFKLYYVIRNTRFSSDCKMQNPAEIVANLRNSFNCGVTRSQQFRENQLRNLIKFYDENRKKLLEALCDDLNKSKRESLILELDFLKNDALHMIYNLTEWMKPRSAEKRLLNIMDKAEILSEPYGVALVIGAWNYPLQLTLSPLTGAIAAGDCAIVKPSEIAPATEKVLAELLPKYLDPNCYKVFVGGPEETQKLLEQRFDYIFYTGSTRVGTIVAQAAAKYLTPTTLELGGKSPCYLDCTVDIEIAAARIVWGKCVNSGQTCVAPDYLLCSQETENKFIKAFKKALKIQYGSNVKNSPDFCRIINCNHFNRIVDLLENQEIATGGAHDGSQRFIEPTICINVDPESPLMKDEIFGPILPIIRVNDACEAITFINEREKPLALYVFSKDRNIVDLFEKQTSSGGICVNDTIMHLACDALPFGGVGNSGLGVYHGKFSFDTFSHAKPILKKSINKFGEMLQSVRYAPYNDVKIMIMTVFTRKRRLPIVISIKYLVKILFALIGFFFGNLYCHLVSSKKCC